MYGVFLVARTPQTPVEQPLMKNKGMKMKIIGDLSTQTGDWNDARNINFVLLINNTSYFNMW